MNLNATLIIEVLSFLILLGVLSKFLFKPLLDVIDKRKTSVEHALAEAETRRQEAGFKLKEAEDILEKTKKEVLDMREQSRLKADETRRQIVESAKKEALKIMDDSKKEINREAELVKKDIGKQISNLSVSIAEKILKREIKAEDHRKLVEDSIREFTDE